MLIVMFKKQDWPSDDEVNLENGTILRQFVTFRSPHPENQIIRELQRNFMKCLLRVSLDNEPPVHMIVIFGKLIVNEKLEAASLPRKWMFGIHHPA